MANQPVLRRKDSVPRYPLEYVTMDRIQIDDLPMCPWIPSQPWGGRGSTYDTLQYTHSMLKIQAVPAGLAKQETVQLFARAALYMQ